MRKNWEPTETRTNRAIRIPMRFFSRAHNTRSRQLTTDPQTLAEDSLPRPVVSLRPRFSFHILLLLSDLSDGDPSERKCPPHCLPPGVNRHLLIGIGKMALDGRLRECECAG